MFFQEIPQSFALTFLHFSAAKNVVNCVPKKKPYVSHPLVMHVLRVILLLLLTIPFHTFAPFDCWATNHPPLVTPSQKITTLCQITRLLPESAPCESTPTSVPAPWSAPHTLCANSLFISSYPPYSIIQDFNSDIYLCATYLCSSWTAPKISSPSSPPSDIP